MAVGLRRNVTISFSLPEYMRLQGAAAVAQMAVTTYVKWLLRGSPVDGMTTSTSLILQRLEEINITMARFTSAQGAQPVVVRVPRVSAWEIIETRLRARGIPSSTIQQVSAVLDDLEAGR